MRVLDCGCGPGTITVGLAGAVAPGEVVGVDPRANRLDLARAAAAAQGIENIRFEQGDMYSLPFDDGTFDAALVHAVMEYLTEPVAALAEVRRVLKPGGVIGVRTAEHGEAIIWPSSEALTAQTSLWRRQHAAVGENFDIGRSLRELLRAAGFSRVVGSASVETHGTLDETRQFAQELVSILYGDPIIVDALRRGWVDADGVEQFKQAWLAWGEHPDAFRAAIWCEAVGWVE